MELQTRPRFVAEETERVGILWHNLSVIFNDSFIDNLNGWHHSCIQFNLRVIQRLIVDIRLTGYNLCRNSLCKPHQGNSNRLVTIVCLYISRVCN
ncbi:hypothetical protein BABINDRAFT_126621 [Babjeviella inositovora NRRL Y-12698]|uniref:Uncharacterized protein n=1 Tax=Babjeviella inositovora NRRL Y-12698 TaxID=984486 RepID=A0A1E3QSW9_9ASCO|nr:uncharacterized protein BABINDRAFT_126621 [Babjeviella inositovora NRRL Y-12698]ODQ80738.1 hypothetical protein BABINDRAFT_126621 [Babjeviella inositovora NRRL Y-12698]